jgi:glycosyltransferase involved in cell wall biosynthesis
MKVGFNARLLADSNTRGWNRYTVNLLAELPNFGVRPILYTDRPIHTDHLVRLPIGSYKVRMGRVRPYVLWEQVWLPRQCARDGVDLFHAPANFGLPYFCQCPRVLTLHDAIGAKHQWPRARLLHAVARQSAYTFITVSEHAKGEIIETYGLDPGRIRVIHEAADPRVSDPITREMSADVKLHMGDNPPYFFYVGGFEERKNLPFLIRAFAEAGAPEACLVLAGNFPYYRREPLVMLADDLGVYGNVRLLDTPSDSDLAALYSDALAFIYPSKHEGFGLQLCEAMALGCPVLAARATSLPEVLGAGGETFTLDDTSELVALMRRVASDSNFRDDLVRRARLRSADFSWKATAEKTVAVYREVLNS